MRIAAVQCDVKIADRRVNLQTVRRSLDQTLRRGAVLTVMPECMLTGYAFENRQKAIDAAVAIDDPLWMDVAKQIEDSPTPTAAVSLGTLLFDGDRLTNSAVLIDRTGIVGRYDKVHLPALGVDQFVDRGTDDYRSWSLGDLNVGLAICYDCSFPEPMRVLGLAGVDVVALGTNWPVAAERTAEVVPPARSMENHYYFVAANRVGTERGFTFCGRSSICGPDGVVLSMSGGDREEILYADIDVELARNKRIERTAGAHVIDRMADRRPERYALIVQPSPPPRV